MGQNRLAFEFSAATRPERIARIRTGRIRDDDLGNSISCEVKRVMTESNFLRGGVVSNQVSQRKEKDRKKEKRRRRKF